MYVPSAEAEAELIAGNRIDGMLPADNSEKTMVGVYVNDVTEGKLDYYAKLSVAATSDQCTAIEPTFSTTATFASTLDPNDVEGLAELHLARPVLPEGRHRDRPGALWSGRVDVHRRDRRRRAIRRDRRCRTSTARP